MLKLSEVEIASTKREGEENLLRDLTWRTLSKRGSSNKQVADRWEDKEGETYAENTIGAAIKRIDEIMHPISNKHEKVTDNKGETTHLD